MSPETAGTHEVFAREAGLLINGTAAPALPALASTAESAPARDASLAHLAQAPHDPLAATPLTRREQEVARLLAGGLTNRQIAEALVITDKTAEAHVGRILGKLGLSNRAQVAAWTLGNAQRALQARAESLAGLARDLKNPLGAIRAGAKILERYARPTDGERWRAGLEAIQASVAKIGALVDELLAVAHPEAPRPVVRRRRPADLVAPVRKATTSHEPAAPRHRLRVEAAALERGRVGLDAIALTIEQTGAGSGPIRPAARSRLAA